MNIVLLSLLICDWLLNQFNIVSKTPLYFSFALLINLLASPPSFLSCSLAFVHTFCSGTFYSQRINELMRFWCSFSTGFSSVHGERPTAEYARLRKESLESEFGHALTYKSKSLSSLYRFGPFMALYRAAIISFYVLKLTVWRLFVHDLRRRAVKVYSVLKWSSIRKVWFFTVGVLLTDDSVLSIRSIAYNRSAIFYCRCSIDRWQCAVYSVYCIQWIRYFSL